VAAGEKLKIAQEDVKLDGWAVESRVYAEDPFRNFLPSTGRLTVYRPPGDGTEDGLTVRTDTGVSEGSDISLYYDPMIAKLITHGPTRDAAIDHMVRALDAFYIDGIQHNIPFLAAIMSHRRWREGALSTGFIAEEYPDGFSPRSPGADERATLAIVAAAIDHLSNQRRREITHQLDTGSVAFSESRVVRLGDDIQPVTVTGSFGEDIEVRLVDETGKPNEPTAVSSDWWFGTPIWTGKLNGVEVSVQVRPVLNGFDLAWRGVHVPAYVYTGREAELAALMPVKEPPDTSMQLLCPMPGLVVAINVEAGQQVKAGEALCVVEAMKMENILRAERDVTVSEILAKPGDSLAVDATIMVFE
jgi:propionyl-CoA carboxylase alpha chain